MSLNFIPHPDDTHKGTLLERIDVLMEGAERYKAIILEMSNKPEELNAKNITPADIKCAYNWEAIGELLREIRVLPEGNTIDKSKKSHCLKKLAEVYEVLRGAKMSKLESVRLALINEANQLQGGSSAAP